MSWSVIGIPIDSVGSPAGGPAFGPELAPAALRGRGVVDRVGARDLGDLDVRVVDPARDPATGMVGGPSVVTMTEVVRRAVADAVGRGERVLVLGGCCSLVPGAVAGLRDALGQVGLVNVDGHVDVYDNRTSPTGEAADMPVATLLGRGWQPWIDAVAPAPVLRGQDVVVVGAREPEEAADIGELPERLGITVMGPGQADGSRARDLLGGLPYWVHLDLDVLDEAVFPATDVLMPGGLDLAQLTDVLRPLLASEVCRGLSVGCYNPTKDPDGGCGAALVDVLVDVLTP